MEEVVEMFHALNKQTGEVVTVYAVMTGLALIYLKNWEWVDLNDLMPADGIT